MEQDVACRGAREIEGSDEAGSGGPGVASFEAFYQHEYRSVVGLAYTLTGSWMVAEELVQDAFLAGHQRWELLRHYDDPGAWVRRVVANRSASYLRRRGAEVRALLRLLRRAPRPAPEVEASHSEFWRMVRALPRRQAQVVALHYLEDRAVEDVARILDLAPGTVKFHLHEARAALAERLRSEDQR